MNELVEKINIINIANGFMFFLTLSVYGMATYWNVRTYIITKGRYHAGLIAYMSFATFVFFGIYSYLFVQSILGNFSDATRFGITVIRPSILLLGGAVASVARARYNALKDGGETWIFPKLET